MRATAPLITSMAGVAVGMTLSVAPVASAAPGVYGGTTRTGEAIVLKTDRTGKRVRSAVMAVVARCDDGDTYPISANVTATRQSPGFDPGPRDLIMSRNLRGRFAGTVLRAESLGGDEAGYTGIVSAEVGGRLRGARASGALSAVVTVVTATGDEVTTCNGRARWKASRSAGRIYAGATSQGEPFVARLDARGRRVEDVHVASRSWDCTPADFVRLPWHFGNFPVDRRGRWGDAWHDDMTLDAGATASFSFDLHGTVRRRSARGMLEVGLERRDAAGAVDLACDSGTVTWKATTG